MRLLGEGVPFISGIDTPEIGSHAKCTRIMNCDAAPLARNDRPRGPRHCPNTALPAPRTTPPPPPTSAA
ncbi:hypothetical protein CO652_03255 [Rhizobium sp. H4]|nr:hypothetical protein CO652_03255 [Rhizobium sp. H4]